MTRRTFTRNLHVVWAALIWLGTSGCGGEPQPTDCGDDSMSIVTFNGKDMRPEEELRICVDIHAASRRDATETSAGLDESFATSRPNVIPWTNLTFGEAIEACGRAGKFLCNSEELQGIAPIVGSGATVEFDRTAITELEPTSADTSVPHRFDRLNPYDMLIREETGKPPFPETIGGPAYWTASPVRQDKQQDPTIPLVLGQLDGDEAISGVLTTSPVLDPSFRHPLLGFRCCIHAKMRSAFSPLPPDPARIREEEDDVPIAGR
jgi:hypothetical protein